MSSFDDARARRYLLGQLSEEEIDALEGEYFADGRVLEQVWGVENDLVDAFAAGELSSEDQAAFESHYLASPVHRERVATARELRAATQGATASTTPRRRIPAWSVWLPLAAVLVLLLASLWVRERPQVPTGPVAQVEATPVATPAAVSTVAAPDRRANPPVPAPPPPLASRRLVAAFALSPALLRGSQAAPALRVAPGTVELWLTLEGERPEGVPSDARLPFVVKTVEGEIVARGDVLPKADGLGVARVAADRVPPGDYILAVGPSEKDGRLLTAREGQHDGPLRQYFFRVLP